MYKKKYILGSDGGGTSTKACLFDDLGETIHQLVGGVKSCLGYCGSKNLDEFKLNAEFVRIPSAGSIESHPHDMNITKDSPNYRNSK